MEIYYCHCRFSSDLGLMPVKSNIQLCRSILYRLFVHSNASLQRLRFFATALITVHLCNTVLS